MAFSGKREAVFNAGLLILAGSCQGGKGAGLHASPAIVKQSIELGELFVAEFEKHEEAREAAEKAKSEKLPEGKPPEGSTPPVPTA